MTNSTPDKIPFPITHKGSMAEHCSLPDSISLSLSDIKRILRSYNSIPKKPFNPESDHASFYLSEYFLQPNNEALDNGFCNEKAYVDIDGEVSIFAFIDHGDVGLIINGGIEAVKSAYEKCLAQHSRERSKEPDSLSA